MRQDQRNGTTERVADEIESLGPTLAEPREIRGEDETIGSPRPAASIAIMAETLDALHCQLTSPPAVERNLDA
jgi:hypothetical protein